ncbi:MAG: hypothetical protein ACM3IJ_00545 [Candidatus Levyibacteriota bacterium]
MGEGLEDKPQRFHQDKLHEDKAANFPHFRPEKDTGKDRFGNRFFSSLKTAFLDREGNSFKAGVLVSPEGEEFLKENLGILQDIDKGLTKMTEIGESKRVISGAIDLGGQRSLAFLGQGAQSDAFMLETPTGRYVVKKGRESKTEQPSVLNRRQPYINEMLQIQELSEDLRKEIAKKGIFFPTFLFASSHVSCEAYEEGVPVTSDQQAESIKAFAALVNKTVQKKNSLPLWRNIEADVIKKVTPYGDKTYEVPLNDLVKRQDGTIVWLDPLMYNSVLDEARKVERESWVKRLFNPGNKRKYDYSG